jgi:hypothetical protein
VFTPFHKPPYTYPYGRSIDETTTQTLDFHPERYDSELHLCRLLPVSRNPGPPKPIWARTSPEPWPRRQRASAARTSSHHGRRRPASRRDRGTMPPPRRQAMSHRQSRWKTAARVEKSPPPSPPGLCPARLLAAAGMEARGRRGPRASGAIAPEPPRSATRGRFFPPTDCFL